jgi:hypothetical protein
MNRFRHLVLSKSANTPKHKTTLRAGGGTLKKYFLFLLVSVFCLSIGGTAWATSFEGAFSEPTSFAAYYDVNYIQLSLNGYDSSQYTIDDFTFTGMFSYPDGPDTIKGYYYQLLVSIKLPGAGADDWQWLGQMQNIQVGSPAGDTLGVTEPDWQPRVLNEALSEDGVLTMKLEGCGGDFILDELSLKITTSESSSPVPEPASLVLLGSGLMGLTCLRFRRIIKPGRNRIPV